NENNPDLKDHQSRGRIMVGLKEAEMMIPIKIGDCTAFENPSDPLVASYLGSSSTSGCFVPFESQRKVSTIISSGTPFHRPKGQFSTLDKASYEFGASRQLDFELELAYVVGKSSILGDSISAADAEDYIFGILLFNDWTARDMQGQSPFLFSKSSKSFASSISYWVVTLDALEPFRTSLPGQEGDLIPYLQTKRDDGFDIRLEAYLKPEKGNENLLCQTNSRHAYWSAAQLLAQQTVNGSNIELGDLVASGTVSNPDEGHYSSIAELLNVGRITTEDGGNREFVQDGDTVSVRGYCEKGGIRVGFGEVVTKVLPSK